jgi:hypothetical protein
MIDLTINLNYLNYFSYLNCISNNNFKAESRIKSKLKIEK